jgi:hypothetical protein
MRQVIDWRVNQRFEDHLCPRHQVTEVLLFCVEWLVRNLGALSPVAVRDVLSWDSWYCGVEWECSEPPRV